MCVCVCLLSCGQFDCRNKTVTVTLWNDLATTIGEQLLDMVDSAPVIAVKSLKVSDFQGMFVMPF